jgi:glycosyltransferase involved in cell wall biosynthesis
MHRHTETTTTQSLEKKHMILSILTPTIPGREKQLKSLQASIEEQIGNHAVEHLILSDNRKRSIGAKRQALLDIARGQYIAFVDDDDDIADNYVEELVNAAASNADVITFLQGASYNGQQSVVDFQLGQGDQYFNPGGITIRDAWHVNAWRRSRVAHCQFGESNYGEDLTWCQQARRMAQTTVHIPKILHFYRHDAAITAAPEPN